MEKLKAEKIDLFESYGDLYFKFYDSQKGIVETQNLYDEIKSQIAKLLPENVGVKKRLEKNLKGIEEALTAGKNRNEEFLNLSETEKLNFLAAENIKNVENAKKKQTVEKSTVTNENLIVKCSDLIRTKTLKIRGIDIKNRGEKISKEFSKSKNTLSKIGISCFFIYYDNNISKDFIGLPTS